ncbi:auxin efflux carrier component 1b-related [Anaeramoeba flamelloides]|uniref:Auxin efflux carrier component 1b-related n=1 Tax=Anaeramoeba flamelloides TaxID=1746091 RepID=A0AAV8A308_9EUKA|nr:auxin efflux carrier component 1b-related [Anaeramoeba flamelloides]
MIFLCEKLETNRFLKLIGKKKDSKHENSNRQSESSENELLYSSIDSLTENDVIKEENGDNVINENEIQEIQEIENYKEIEIENKSDEEDEKATRENERDSSLKICLKSFFKNPLVIGSFLGLIYSFSGLPLPAILDKTTTYFSDLLVPLSLITVGMFIYREKVMSCPIKILTIYMVAKFVLCPFFALILIYIFRMSGDPAKALFFLAALPIGLSTFTMSEQYTLKTEYIAPLFFFETILFTPIYILYVLIVESTNLIPS